MPSSSSTNSWILSLKAVLISAGLVSVAVMMKLAIPLMLNFAVSDLPAIWSVLVSLLKPPYLYVVINGIIITIAASTRFQHNNHQDNENHSQQQVNPPSDLASDLPPASTMRRLNMADHPPVVYDIEPNVMEPPVVYESAPAVVDVKNMVALSGPEVVGGDEDAFVVSRPTWNPPQSIIKGESPSPKKVQPEFDFPVRERQLLSSRFSQHRKPTPEGARVLRVLKPKKHETMETTWKMITEKRHMPLTRHLRKSDTFVNHHNDVQSDESEDVATTTTTTTTKVVKKSETFKDRSNYENQNDYPKTASSAAAAGGKLKKEASLSNDELNRRVEAFIKKFNDDMRLQRQESLNQYMEMVNHGDGAH
ncbi:hypothetical protein Lser_V15G16553 [Lactuca serriola]